jgi:GT2 family glycosyltransferase
MEILVADGMSGDGTREVIAEYARRDPRVKMLDNPKRILASAWNAGIRAARGEIIMALNAHTVFPPAYVSTCISLMSQYPEAAYIGGIVRTRPQDDTPLGRALALAVSHRLASAAPASGPVQRHRNGPTQRPSEGTGDRCSARLGCSMKSSCAARIWSSTCG